MRFLVAGLVLIAIGIGLTEYSRRTGKGAAAEVAKPDDAASPGEPSKPKLPAKVAALLAVAPAPADDVLGAADEATQLLSTLKADAPPIGGFSPLLSGAFTARQVRAGFGYAVVAVDVGAGSALVRVEPGTPPKLVYALKRRLTALTLDASALFFADGARVFTASARGGEAPQARIAFREAVVTALAASGDDVVAAVMPKDQVDSDAAVGAVVRIDAQGDVTLLAADQARPRDVRTDGKEAFWVASGLWRAALDGSFSSRIAEGADGPLALDGEALVAAVGDEVQRLSRAGGKPQVLAPAKAAALVASSGLVRYATDEAQARLFEVTAGAEPTLSATLAGPVSAMALGGTTLFVVSTDASGAAVLLAK